jgi:hypothetical protein
MNLIAAYSVGEDRILLEVCGEENRQSFWLTRRALIVLNEAIHHVLRNQYDLLSLAAQSPEHSDAFAQFGQSLASEKYRVANHNQPVSVDQEALLVYEIGYQVIDQNLCTLKLSTRNGIGCHYQFSREVLHAFVNLLNEQLKQANWGMTLTTQQTPLGSSATSEVPPTRILH